MRTHGGCRPIFKYICPGAVYSRRTHGCVPSDSFSHRPPKKTPRRSWDSSLRQGNFAGKIKPLWHRQLNHRFRIRRPFTNGHPIDCRIRSGRGTGSRIKLGGHYSPSIANSYLGATAPYGPAHGIPPLLGILGRLAKTTQRSCSHVLRHSGSGVCCWSNPPAHQFASVGRSLLRSPNPTGQSSDRRTSGRRHSP